MRNTARGMMARFGTLAVLTLLIAGFGGLGTTEVLAAPAPTIRMMSPTTGTAGTLVHIEGTNFVPGATTITFGGVAGNNIVCRDADHCDVNAPAGTGTVPVVLGTAGGTVAAGSFTYTTPPVPTITSITPTSGSDGASVTITGTNFVVNGTTINFGSVPAPAPTCTTTSCTTTVPAGTVGSTTVSVTATTAAGTSNGVPFTYVTANGCPEGEVLSAQGCVPAGTNNGCPVGFVLVGTTCVPTGTGTGCPLGYVLIGTSCVPSGSGTGCPFGYVLIGTSCVPSTSTSGCSYGYVATTQGCLPAANGYCPAGEVSTTSGCLPAATSAGNCAAGTVWNGQQCVPVNSTTTSCPAGTYLANGTCVSTTTTTTTTTTTSGPMATYQPGWNLVGGGSGTQFLSADNPLYTYQAGDTNYETLPNTSGIAGGEGYWAYFNTATSVPLSTSGPNLPSSVFVPAGQFVMVGNPSTTGSATVTGADVVYTFNPSTNSYTNAGTTATLAPGQGAWVYSINGASVSLH